MTEDHDLELVEQLADEFANRLRAGERPSIKEYADRHPELAEIIRDTFEALAMMENMAPGSDDSFDEPGAAVLPELKQLGDFRIISEVGRGGMGVVYEAEQVSLGRHVALKVLPSAALPDDKHIRRFEREAKSAAKLHHTNIVPVFGVGAEQDLRYYVMQFIQGLPLDEVIDELKKIRAQPSGTFAGPVRVGEARDHEAEQEYSVTDMARSLMTGQFAQTVIGNSDDSADDAHPNLARTITDATAQAGDSSASRLSETFNLSGSSSESGVRLGNSGSLSSQRKSFTYWESVANIGLQVADAMQYAHDQGILHRDIKPSNLLLDMKGTAWVTDFGLAKATDQQDITHTGDILGTLRYMPPEAFEGTADARSDVYSLGLTLYELLCFQSAFGMKDRNRLIKQVTTETAPRLEKLNPEIPRDLVTIVHKAIDREPSHRYASARELEEDLQRFLDDEPIKARRVSMAERVTRWSRRNKGLARALAAVCLLLLVINIAGPVMTWRLQEEKQKLLKSQSDLRKAVANLEAREKELEETGRQLEEQTHRANEEAADARLLAAENRQIADDKTELAVEADRQRILARRALYSSALYAAQQALSTPGGYARAQELLDEVRPQAGEDEDLRGWEWYYLQAQRPSGGFIVDDFSKSPIAVAYSPDGRFLAAGDSSGKVQLFDADSGRLERTLSGHQGRVWTLSWSPDGSRFVSGSEDRTARIWNPRTGLEERQLLGHLRRVSDVAWSPDGKRLVTASMDSLIKTWDAESGDNLRTLKGHTRAVYSVDWSPAGRLLVSAGHDETVRTWNADTGEAVRVLTGHAAPVECVQFSPHGRRVASAGYRETEKQVIIWDVESGKELLTLPPRAFALSWSPDGSQLATTDWYRRTTDVWDANTGENLHSFSMDGSPFKCSWSPDGRRLASASTDNTVQVWDVVRKKPAPDFLGHGQRVRTLAWNRDGSRIATASFDKTVNIWDVATRQELLTFDRHANSVYCVDWNRDGTRLASSGQEQVFHVWEAETGTVLDTVQAAENGDVNAVAWSPDGTRIASAADDKTVRVFDAESGKELNRFHLNDSALSVDWSFDGGRIAAGSNSGELKVWEVTTGREFAHFSRHDQTLWTVRFSPDGTKLAAGGERKPHEASLVFGDTDSGAHGTLTLWDLTTRQELHQFHGHSYAVRSVDWSRDGTRLLSAGHDGTITLWDTQTGAQLLAIDDPDGQPVISARFSPDELQIASAGDAPGIRLLDTTAGHVTELSPRLLPGLNRRIARNPAISDLILRARILAAQAEWDRAAADYQQADRLRNPDDDASAWMESSWWVAGPYPKPLDENQPPESHLDPLKPIPSAENSGLPPRHWRRAHLSASHGLNLGRIFAGAEQTSAYAMTRVFAAQRQSAGLLLGADDTARVWLNGTHIHTDNVGGRAVPDEDVVSITLQPGWNTLLFEVSNDIVAYGLFARLSQDPLELARAFARDENWTEAYTWWERAYVEDPDDSEVLVGRGRAALAVSEAEIADQSFHQALEYDEPYVMRGVASAYADHARSLINSGQANRAGNSVARARTLFEELLSGGAGIDQDAAKLANILHADTHEWTVLRPIEVSGAAGETFTPQSDGSIFVSGPNPQRAVYTLRLPLDERPVYAIRLETLPDARLPHGGAGRFPDNGNFHLSMFTAALADGEGAEPQLLPILSAVDDHHFGPEHAANAALDGNPNTYWDTHPAIGNAHSAVFALPSPIQATDGRLIVTLDSGITSWGGHGLGRFRLSVTDDPDAFETRDRYSVIARIEDPRERLAATYAALGDASRSIELFDRVLEHTPQFAARRELVERIMRLPTDLGRIVALHPDDPILWRALAQQQAIEDQRDAAAESLERARTLTEGLLAEAPNDESVASFLADLLLTDTTRWVVLEPIEMTSAGGATLSRLGDDSVLAGGVNPDHDAYTIATKTELQQITAIRLEALEHDSLPGQGPGRYSGEPGGAFLMDGLHVSTTSGSTSDASKAINLDAATADYFYLGHPITPDGAWHGGGNSGGRACVAVYRLGEQVELAEGSRVTFQMTFHHRSQWPRLQLGRFRLTATDSPNAFDACDRRFQVSRIDDPWARLCSAHILSPRPDPAPAWFTEALQHVTEFTDIVELIDRFDGLQVDLHDLVALRPNDPWLWSALAKQQASDGNADAAAESLAEARRVAETLLADTRGWTILEPTEMTVEGAATFTSQTDGSILASGPQVSGDVYTIRAPVVSEIQAIRLEALPDPSLPRQGPGRHSSGNFQLEELRVYAASGEDGAPIDRRPIANAWASFAYQASDADILGTIDENDPRVWHVIGRHGERHVAVFEFTTPLQVPAGQPLIIECAHRDVHDGINLGRFRLSVTDDPAVVAAERQRWIRAENGQSQPDEAVAGLLADLMLVDDTRWTVPEPVVTPTSHGGSTLAPQSDGSIFVSGMNPDEDLYTVVLPLTSTNVRALRLETLADERLPFAGSGRSTINGNFRLGEFSLSLRSAGDPESETPIPITRAYADVAGSEGRVIERALDGDRTTHWTPFPYQDQDHDAVFEFEPPPSGNDGLSQLVVRMDTGSSPWPEHGIGRFRLSVSEDPSASIAQRVQQPWLKLAAAYFLEGDTESAGDCFARAIETSTDLAATSDQIASLPADLRDLMADPDDIEWLIEERLAQSTPGVRQQVWTRTAGNHGWWHYLRSRESLPDLITQRRSEGMRLTFLSTSHRENSPDPEFVTIWSADGTDHRIEPDLTRAELDELLNTLPEDMQLVSLEEYADGESTRFAALWVAQATWAPWELHERLSASETEALAESMPARGFRPTYVNLYPDGTLTTVWVQDEGDSELLLGLTHRDLRNIEQERSADGLPICIDSYHDAQRRRYCVIIDRSVTDVEWRFSLLERRVEFQSVFNRNVESGWKPIATTESPVGLPPEALLDPKRLVGTGGASVPANADWTAAIEWLDRAMNAVADNAEERARLLRLRGTVHIRAGQWSRAAADIAECVELDPAAGSIAWMVPAALWAYAGDAEQHHLQCRKMTERFPASDNAANARRTVKVMLLMEQGLDPEHAPVKPFLAGLAGDTLTPVHRNFSLSTRALLACRSGEFQEAQCDVEQALQMVAGESRGLNRVLFALAVQALIQSKQGNLTAAQTTVDEFKVLLATEAGLAWRDDGSLDGSTIVSGERIEHELLISEILRREAERLIQDAATREQSAEGDDTQP